MPVPGERPQGTAHRWNTCFALEATPREWDRMRDPAGWSARQREVMGRLGEHVRASGLGYGLLMFTSTRLERGEGGLRRVRVYTRPHGAFASYDRADYQLHGEELFALMEAALLDTPHPELEERRAQTPSGSDWHVCTHGRVDAACGKFGVPLEAALSSTPEGKRVWRTSHFGGHRFAPTVQELPAGRTWAHMTPELTGRLMRREGDHRVLAPHYRGWSALEPLAQVAEAEAFARSGWWWLDTPKAAQTQQREEDRATVQLDFVGPDGTPGTLTAEVEITHHLQTRGSSHKPGTSAAPQYSVRFLENG
ncbi:sucrase ferredoxin [Deinococcus hopiensis]|uniref:sucrase ferredoxin n=1 Tax=Deinococcus hopiensis TaxID=309885 RepID=UPI001483B359|nr:sucrase ferredoxin [Deinococcus hopiensis]